MSGGNIYLSSGSASTPALLFSDHTNTGIYLASNAKIAISTSGVQRLYINTACVTSNLQIRGITGSASTPAYAFSNATNTGLFLNGDDLSLSVDGNTVLTLKSDLTMVVNGSSGIQLPVGTTLEQPISPTIGTMRFNTTNTAVEIYNGVSWNNVLFENRNIKTASVKSVTSDYIITNLDYYIFVDASEKSINITLPVSYAGETFIIKKVDSSNNAVTIIPPESSSIDGYTTYGTSNPNDTFTLTTDGSKWYIVGVKSDNIAM